MMGRPPERSRVLELVERGWVCRRLAFLETKKMIPRFNISISMIKEKMQNANIIELLFSILTLSN